jgi:hypothetical protein
MSAYYRYNITFGFKMEKAYRLLNKAFGCNMKNNSDKYIGDGFKLSMDGDMVFVYFESIENREFVISIIDKVADALCADRYYDLYDDEDDCEVYLYDDESMYVNTSEAVAVSKPIGDKIVIRKSSSEGAHIDPNYDDESLYVNASEANALARGPKTTVSAIGKYTTTFGELDSERSYKLINKALGFKALRDGCDTYTRAGGASPAFGKADNYTIMMDYSMMYVHFTSVEDTEYVRGVITMIAEALGDEPEHHFELYNEETDDYVNI